MNNKMIVIPLLVVGFVVAMGLFVRIMIAWHIPEATVTSWWRSILKNRSVGGVPKSRHLIGWAFDVVPVTREIYLKMKRIPFAKDVINEGDHIHMEMI